MKGKKVIIVGDGNVGLTSGKYFNELMKSGPIVIQNQEEFKLEPFDLINYSTN